MSGVTQETHESTRTFTVIDCGSCGGSYALSKRFVDERYKYGGHWTCPYCKCGWGYSKENTELAREKERANKAERSRDHAWDAARKERENHRRTEARRRAEKAAKTRLKNKISKGQCPCCRRNFDNLARHMANQHPDFVPEKEGEE